MKTTKTSIKSKSQVRVVVKKKRIYKKSTSSNKKAKKFFKKRVKSEKIFKNEDDETDEFSELKVFKNSYFYRSYMNWNNLPLELKIIQSYDEFKNKLEAHFWKIIDGVVDADNDTSELLIGLPGD